MGICQTFESDGELHITRANNVLYLEILKFGRESELLYNTCILKRKNPGKKFIDDIAYRDAYISCQSK